MRFVPDFLLRDMVGWLVAVGLLAALAAFFPWELGVKADPFAPAPAGIRPEWYFLWMFQALKYLPAEIAGIPGETLGVFFFGGLAARPRGPAAARPQASRGASGTWPPSSSLIGAADPDGARAPAARKGDAVKSGSSPPSPGCSPAAAAARAGRAGAAAKPRRPSIGCVDCHLALDDAAHHPAREGLRRRHPREVPASPASSATAATPNATDQEVAHDPQEGIPRKALAPRHSRPLRHLPLPTPPR